MPYANKLLNKCIDLGLKGFMKKCYVLWILDIHNIVKYDIFSLGMTSGMDTSSRYVVLAIE